MPASTIGLAANDVPVDGLLEAGIVKLHRNREGQLVNERGDRVDWLGRPGRQGPQQQPWQVQPMEEVVMRRPCQPQAAENHCVVILCIV